MHCNPNSLSTDLDPFFPLWRRAFQCACFFLANQDAPFPHFDIHTDTVPFLKLVSASPASKHSVFISS